MPAISFQSVTKTYPSTRGGSGLRALDEVSFDIAEGEFFGLLGPNGAGKTTLISILAGLTRATSGRVTVQGCDVQTDYAQARRRLGVVPQELVFDPFFNVREAGLTVEDVEIRKADLEDVFLEVMAAEHSHAAIVAAKQSSGARLPV